MNRKADEIIYAYGILDSLIEYGILSGPTALLSDDGKEIFTRLVADKNFQP